MGRGPRYYESRLNRRDSVDKSADNEVGIACQPVASLGNKNSIETNDRSSIALEKLKPWIRSSRSDEALNIFVPLNEGVSKANYGGTSLIISEQRVYTLLLSRTFDHPRSSAAR